MKTPPGANEFHRKDWKRAFDKLPDRKQSLKFQEK